VQHPAAGHPCLAHSSGDLRSALSTEKKLAAPSKHGGVLGKHKKLVRNLGLYVVSEIVYTCEIGVICESDSALETLLQGCKSIHGCTACLQASALYVSLFRTALSHDAI